MDKPTTRGVAWTNLFVRDEWRIIMDINNIFSKFIFMLVSLHGQTSLSMPPFIMSMRETRIIKLALIGYRHIETCRACSPNRPILADERGTDNE